MQHQNYHNSLSDEELIHKYRTTGNNEWLGILLPRYTALLYGVAMKYLKNKTKAEDAVQQIFLKVLSVLPSEKIINFKGWLYVLMRNHCLHEIRDTKLFLQDDILAFIQDTGNTEPDIKFENYSVQQLNDAIEMLNDEQNECIVLFYLKKYSYEQIVNATGYTFMEVKSYIQNGKRNLKTLLLKQHSIKN